MKRIPQEMHELAVACASKNYETSMNAQYQMVEALAPVLREGVLSGDIVTDIFEMLDYTQATEDPYFPLDVMAPGTEKDFYAYAIPNQGKIPERQVHGDYVRVPTYDVGNSIDWLLKMTRQGWNVVERCMEILRMGVVKKMNDDGFHILLGAAADRNIMVFDANAAAGQFTKRLVSLMQITMRRNGGGNSTSVNRGKLTDLYISPESMEDMRDWGVDQVDDFTRREIYTAADGSLTNIFGVNLHDTDEFGEEQEYQEFFLNDLGGELASGDVELVLGLDLSRRGSSTQDSFVMPIRSEFEVHPDPTLHRQRRQGVYGWMEYGVSCLDNRRVLLGSH